MYKTCIIEIPEEKTKMMVKEYLKELGYDDSLEILTQINEDIISYEIYNTINYHGKETKILKLLDCNDYMEILKSAFEQLENKVSGIYPIIKHNKIYFNVAYTYNVKTYRK